MGSQGEQRNSPGNYVYRFDPNSKTATAVIKDFDKPNGLAFSPMRRNSMWPIRESRNTFECSTLPKMARSAMVEYSRRSIKVVPTGFVVMRRVVCGRVREMARRSSLQMGSCSHGFFCLNRLLISPLAVRMDAVYS